MKLLQMDLKSAKIPVIHIDNPIYNNDVEDGNVYLRKVEESVESLLLMLKDYDLSQKLAEINKYSRAHVQRALDLEDYISEQHYPNQCYILLIQYLCLLVTL